MTSCNGLNIQDVLIDAGYHLNRRDGLRYPSYVRLDSDGRRIRGDKFIVTQQGKCCFHAQQQKVYNIISFIKEHPHFFTEYHAGMSPDRLVNLVCNPNGHTRDSADRHDGSGDTLRQSIRPGCLVVAGSHRM